MDIKPVDLTTMEPPKRRRGRPAGSKGKKKKQEEPSAPTSSWNPFGGEDPEEAEKRERKELEEKLLNFADANPDVVLKPINNKINSTVKEMDIEELRARVRMGRKISTSKLDNCVGGQVIFLANETVGRMLNCVKELHESTENDRLLQECTTEYLSMHLLDYIPIELKISGIYASHVIKSYYEAVKAQKDPNMSSDKKNEVLSNFKNQLLALRDGMLAKQSETLPELEDTNELHDNPNNGDNQ